MRNVSGVLGLLRLTKNSLASINQIPPEVLSLIAQNCDTDEDLLTLTHVCHSWREIFISHASLWTNLDCPVVDKTRVYLERSKTSLLRICLEEQWLNDAFLLTVPHIGRFESFSLSGPLIDIIEPIEHLKSPSPLLKALSLAVTDEDGVYLPNTIFGGGLPSLYKLHFVGIVPDLDKFGNMPNLRTLSLSNVPPDLISVTELLDFFECAPLLREILLEYAFPKSSNAPLGRIVPLPNLKHFTISAPPPHTILMNHLLILTGASINQKVTFHDTGSPISSLIPKDFDNLKHLSNITSITLDFTLTLYLRFEGPSGVHCISSDWLPQGPFPTSLGCSVLESLDVLSVSVVEMLQIEQWQSTISSTSVEESSIYRTFHCMDNLRALTLTACLSCPFFHALNPRRNASGVVICPKLKELVVYTWTEERNPISELLGMAKEQASRGTKLETVVIAGAEELLPATVLEVRTYISRVEYIRFRTPPEVSTSDESDSWV